MSEDRVLLHYAIQGLAALNRALLPKAADWSHTALAWDSEQSGFCSAAFDLAGDAAGADPSATWRIVLDPSTLECRVQPETADGGAPSRFQYIGSTLAEAFEWHRQVARDHGVAPAEVAAVEPLTYPPDDFPAHAVADGAALPAGDSTERAQLGELFGLSHGVLGAQAERPQASSLRLWPHHFDLATLITLRDAPDGDDEGGVSVGVGFSPGDSRTDEPYWYVTPWPYPDPAGLPDLSAGSWNTDGWVGASLRLSQTAEPTRAEQVQRFISEAVEASVALLSG